MYDALDTLLCFGSVVIRWLLDGFNASVFLNLFFCRCPCIWFFRLCLTDHYLGACLRHFYARA